MYSEYTHFTVMVALISLNRQKQVECLEFLFKMFKVQKDLHLHLECKIQAVIIYLLSVTLKSYSRFKRYQSIESLGVNSAENTSNSWNFKFECVVYSTHVWRCGVLKTMTTATATTYKQTYYHTQTLAYTTHIFGGPNLCNMWIEYVRVFCVYIIVDVVVVAAIIAVLLCQSIATKNLYFWTGDDKKWTKWIIFIDHWTWKSK